MAVEIFPGDNWAPLEVGVVFRFGNSDHADQWVEIYALDNKYVYARGIGNHIADLKIERWKFDDVVSDKDYYDSSTEQPISGDMPLAPPSPEEES